MHMLARCVTRTCLQTGPSIKQLISTTPLISIRDTDFHRAYPSQDKTEESRSALFNKLTFSVRNSDVQGKDCWAIISPSSISRTSFLQVLAGQYVAIPPSGRTYPYLSEIGSPLQNAIKYVGFDAERGNTVSGTSVRGAYLSARYESRREETDFSVRDYLLGNTELNALEKDQILDETDLLHITTQLDLGRLLDMPVSNLSNGQTRRARIAKALMGQPELLLLDGPFMGLDPSTVSRLSGVLEQISHKGKPQLIISLRPEDIIPQWITKLMVINTQNRIIAQGVKEDVISTDETAIHEILSHNQTAQPTTKLSRDAFEKCSPSLPKGEALIEMRGVKVSYGDKTVLGGWEQNIDGDLRPGLWWSLHRGQRCGIFGPNGSGKTTMLSLITSDHPQTYSLPIKLFGRSRLPEPGERGITLFDLQKRMGHSSPEVHAFFPKQLTLRRALESAWADAPMAKPKLDANAHDRVDAFLRWFTHELRTGTLRRMTSSSSLGDGQGVEWANDTRFGELSFSSQRLVLFLRALVASPDLVILDEALSGVDESVRDKALLFLSHGENITSVVDGQAVNTKSPSSTFEGLSSEQALLVISHAKEDVPGCVREWICLPEPGEGRSPKIGSLEGPLELNPHGWKDIWTR